MNRSENLLKEVNEKRKLSQEHYRDRGWGRGDCTKGWSIEAEGYGKYTVSYWDNEGNYAGGNVFSSGPVYWNTAYTLILGREAYLKELTDKQQC